MEKNSIKSFKSSSHAIVEVSLGWAFKSKIFFVETLFSPRKEGDFGLRIIELFNCYFPEESTAKQLRRIDFD